MIKNKYLILFLLLVFLIIFLVFSKTAQKQNLKSTTPSNKNQIETSLLPSQTVINFYDSYLTNSGNLLLEDAYKNSVYLTEDLKIKIKSEILKKPTLNPILCSAEKPEVVRVHSATISGNFAEVLVTQTLNNKSVDSKLNLKMSQNKYKIYEIICN